MCQRMKNKTEAPAEKLMANKVLEKAWIHLIVDFIMKLLLVAGKDVILVVCDMMSKMAHCGNYRENNSRRVGKIV